jgi:hypothetical protein
MTTGLSAAMRRHPAIAVPLAAAALTAVLGFSVTAYIFAATVAQAEALHVPEAFVPRFHRVEAVGRGLLVVCLLAAVLAIVLVLAARLTSRAGAHLATAFRPLVPGPQIATRFAGLVALAAVTGFVWLNAVAAAAFAWPPNPVDTVWLVAETAETAQPVLVLTDDAGNVLLRPLTRVGEGAYAPCGVVVRPAGDSVGDLVLVEAFADEIADRVNSC